MLSPVLSEILFWLAAGICAVAQIAVLRAALAGRTPGASRSAASRGLELFWVVLPAVALLFVLLWTWRSLPSRHHANVSVSGSVGAVTHVTPQAIT